MHQQQTSSTSSPCSSNQSQNGMSHSGGGRHQQQQQSNSHSQSSESGSLPTHMLPSGTTLGQPYAAETSNFGPTLYHHHLNFHNHPQLNGFSANSAGHYNLHYPHPYNKATSTSPAAGQHGVSHVVPAVGSGGSSSRSPSEVESGTTSINADYLGTYHPHAHHQGFYSSLHHHHPYQHMVRSNGTYIDFVPR